MALVAAMLFTIPLHAFAGGTDILHFTATKAMTNAGVESNADGMVTASQKEQGKANNQKLTIVVTGLLTNTTYELVAAIDSDTNIMDITSFVTDGMGKAILEYTSLGNGHGGAKHSSAIPTNIASASLIREVDIVSTNSGTNLQVVLSADLSMPDKLQYLIKRDLSSGGIKSSLMVQATTKKTQFRLLSTGLAPNTDYLLALNGEVVQTNTSSSNGRLDIHSLTDTPPYILDVRSVELWDTSSNVVLETELP